MDEFYSDGLCSCGGDAFSTEPSITEMMHQILVVLEINLLQLCYTLYSTVKTWDLSQVASIFSSIFSLY
jgi:hypothetical protein